MSKAIVEYCNLISGIRYTKAFGTCVNSKIKKLSDHIHVLEEKLQLAYNENAKLKVTHREDEFRLQNSKISCAKAFCDQLTETLQTLADQIQKGKKFVVDT
ncbi:hypothetical protein HanPI659440_Chr02g0085471 [Helianthus annuus]|nr:hypothetical protein HanPI659440_Chr02g0085471 [Helianthus annuus]